MTHKSLEVARQVGTGLFMITVDHLIFKDYVCHPLLNDFVIDLDEKPGIVAPSPRIPEI